MTQYDEYDEIELEEARAAWRARRIGDYDRNPEAEELAAAWRLSERMAALAVTDTDPDDPAAGT